MDLQEQPQYDFFNGSLTGEINKIYKDIINCEVARPSYSDKKRPSHFGLKKRKGYRRMSVGLSTRGVTDVKVIQGGGCGEDADKTFLYLLSPDKTEFEIWKRPDSCDFEAEKLVEGSTCACGFNKFLEVDHAIGLPKIFSANGFSGGVQSNVTVTNYSFGGGPVQGRLSITGNGISYGTGGTQVNIGDYIVIRTSPLYTSGQSKRVTGYDATRNELILDTPRTGFPSGVDHEDGATASAYPRWGTTLLYADATGPVSLNVEATSGTVNEKTLRFEMIKDKCITSMSVSGGLRNFLTTEGYIVFGGAGLDVGYYTGSELIGEQYNNIIPFRGYNILTSDSQIKAGIVSTADGTYMQSLYNLSNDMGLWTRDAHTQFNNSLYVLGSNRRLYAASISGSGSTNVNPQIDLESMSEPIIGELDLIRPGQNVSLYADEKTIKIFITGEVKTKVLIYESDYGFWHIHKIMNAEIVNFQQGFYIGDGLYRYCGITDGALLGEDGSIDTNKGIFFDQHISAIIGENEPNGMSFNVFQEKMMSLIKLNIGPSILNDEDSYVLIESNRSGYRSKLRFNKWSGIDRVNNYNSVFAGNDFTPDSCVVDQLSDCELVRNEFAGSLNKDETFGGQSSLVINNLCQCPTTFYDPSDMVDGYDSRSYALSDAYNVMVRTSDLSRSSYFTVRFVSGKGDRMWFNGFFAQLLQANLGDGDSDEGDIVQASCDGCEN